MSAPKYNTQRELCEGENLIKRIQKSWRPSRSRSLYEPTDLQPGAWITWERRSPVPGKTTWTNRETMTGQVWSAAPDDRSVWAIVEGETAPALVRDTSRRGAKTRILAEDLRPPR